VGIVILPHPDGVGQPFGLRRSVQRIYVNQRQNRGENAVARTIPTMATENRKARNACDAAGFVLAACLLGSFLGCEGMVAQSRNSDGVQLYQQARYSEALREFQEATYADPTSPEAYYNIAATYHRVGRLDHRQSDLDQAEMYYNQCLDREPNHTDCYRGLAVLLVEEGRKDDARRLLEGWSQRSPNVADAKIELARLNEEFGNRPAAKEHLLEALAIQRDNPRALAALGKIREESGETSQALADYQRSLQYDNRQPQVAARISALQTCSGINTGNSNTRYADRNTNTQLR
jgi:tetratricopeptide (TPR) repeat protein